MYHKIPKKQKKPGGADILPPKRNPKRPQKGMKPGWVGPADRPPTADVAGTGWDQGGTAIGHGEGHGQKPHTPPKQALPHVGDSQRGHNPPPGSLRRSRHAHVLPTAPDLTSGQEPINQY